MLEISDYYYENIMAVSHAKKKLLSAWQHMYLYVKQTKNTKYQLHTFNMRKCCILKINHRHSNLLWRRAT